MQVICRGKQTGKTEEAIRIASSTGAYLVVISRAEAQRVSALADQMRLPIRHPVTADELAMNQMRKSWVRNVVIDNAELVLARIFSHLTIEAVTLTQPDASASVADGNPPGGGDETWYPFLDRQERSMQSMREGKCGCLTCLKERGEVRVQLCSCSCGNKRCPRSSDHRLECTGSNEPGQPGSWFA